MTDSPMETVVSRDGTEIAYERRGDGPLLLLVHGSAASRTIWYASVPSLAEEYTVCVVDRRGRGESGDAAEYSLTREIEDLHAIIDTEGERATVYGHSYGALCALELAKQTDHVSQLVLFEPPLLVPPHDQDATLATDLWEHVAAGREETAKRLFFEEAAGMDADEILPFVESIPARTIARECEIVESYQLDSELAVSTRTLLLDGAESPTHLRDATTAIAEALPDSKVITLPNIGHGSPTANQVTDHVMSFFST